MNDNKTPILNKEYLKKNNILWKYKISVQYKEKTTIINTITLSMWEEKIIPLVHSNIQTNGYYLLKYTVKTDFPFQTSVIINSNEIAINDKPYFIISKYNSQAGSNINGIATTPKQAIKCVKTCILKLIKQQNNIKDKNTIYKGYKQFFRNIIKKIPKHGITMTSILVQQKTSKTYKPNNIGI